MALVPLSTLVESMSSSITPEQKEELQQEFVKKLWEGNIKLQQELAHLRRRVAELEAESEILQKIVDSHKKS